MLQQQQKHNLSQTPFFWVAPSLISRDMTFQSACAKLIEILILVWDLEIGKCWILTQSVSQLYTERCLPIQPMWCLIINQTPKLKNVYLSTKLLNVFSELQNVSEWIAKSICMNCSNGFRSSKCDAWQSIRPLLLLISMHCHKEQSSFSWLSSLS